MRTISKHRVLLLLCMMFSGITWASHVPFGSNPAKDFINDSLLTSPSLMANFQIGNIIVIGNKKTKAYIIERELPFKTGDTVRLAQLVQDFEVARDQLMNSKLFNDVSICIKAFRGYEVDILIDVKERWYLFPLPYFKAVDRNIYELRRQGVGLNRLNYGFKLMQNNFSGRNDKLKLWLITGYTSQFQFEYEQPYADKSLKHGFKLGFSYSYNHELNYATLNNQQEFSDTLGGIKKWLAHVDYSYRPGLRTYYNLRLSYVHQQVDSAVIKANPHYFFNNKTKLGYPELSFSMSHFQVDYIPFPLKGWMGEFEFLKKGVNKEMNLWQLSGRYARSWDLQQNNYYMVQASAMLRLPFHQPFVNQRMFGFGDFYMRGYDGYVVDGVAGALVKQSLRKKLLYYNLPTHLKSRSHSSIPFTFYGRIFGDWGYAHNPVDPQNSLTNRMLYSGGIGLDIVSFYDFVLRMDYSINQLGQKGLFLHVKGDF